MKCYVPCALLACELFLARGVMAQATSPAATRRAASAPATAATLPAGVSFEQLRWEAFRAALQLEDAGKLAEAFRAYLAIPGAEHAAAALLRRDPATLRPILEEIAKQAQASPQAVLLSGEQLLATGDKAGARAAYRALLGMEGYTRGYYIIEPPQPTADGPYPPSSPLLPFSIGPGSHRDNWLLRRFIALEAWDDAATEFARVQSIHKKAAEDGQYSAQGLQFVIDHAYFLTRQKRSDDALQLLQEVLLRIDLDRRPPQGGSGFYRAFGSSSGLARKEFVRLAYGQFKTEGKEAALIAAVQARIDAGHNPARRLLARLSEIQQKPEEALALELAYIEKGGFNDLSAAIRRGTIFDDLKKLPEAAAEYEKALALVPAPLNLPDPDEPDGDAMSAYRQQISLPGDAPAMAADPRGDLLSRLKRLYAALGKADRLLDVTLQELSLGDQNLSEHSLLRAAAAFKAAGQQARFNDWVRARAASVTDLTIRAELYAVLHDAPRLLEALGQLAKAGQLKDHTYDQWRQRVESLGEPSFRDFLIAIVEAEPRHARARLDLLNLDKNAEGPAVISALEAILDGDAPPAFARYKGSYSATEFRSYFDLAYRLMRLYEKEKQIDKLVAMGLRVARGDKPFNTPSLSSYGNREFNDLPEHANACLALAITHADVKARESLSAALQKSPWEAARAQLARVQSAATAPAAPKPFGWANLPAGVRLLAANENVLTLARDDQYLFAGHPWGVAVYRLDGTPVVRVAIEDAALHLCPLKDALWVGGSTGLHRVDLKSWAVTYMAFNQDGQDRDPKSLDGVCGLARDGDLLWIGTVRDLRTYNPATNELRLFTPDDLGAPHPAQWNRFLFTDDHIWADGSAGLRRYDRRTGLWAAPAAVGERAVSLLGMIDGRLWGEVWLNDQLRARPALIDPQTLAVTPILIEGTLSPSQQMVNGPWRFLGRYKGQIVLGANERFLYDAQARKLKPMPQGDNGDAVALDTPIPRGLSSGAAREDIAGIFEATDDFTHQHDVLGQPFHARSWTMLRLPDGNWVLGGSHSRSPRYLYPGEDWPFAVHEYQTPDGSGGLHLLTADGKRRHLSSGFADTLLGDNVFDVLEDGDRTWICTDYGLARLDAAGHVTDRFTLGSGLLGNRISAGAKLGGKLYFATRHDDAAGGLIVFDPATRLFTSLLESDGLSSDALEFVEARGDALALTYGAQYRRSGDARYQLFPAGTYTPGTGVFSPRSQPANLSQSDAGTSVRRNSGEAFPLLGGSVISRRTIGGRTVLCGTRGVLIMEAGAGVQALKADPARLLTPRITFSPDTLQRQEAARIRIASHISVDDLRQHLTNANPYIVAAAIAGAHLPIMDDPSDAHIALIAPLVKHPHRQVRSTAIYVLASSRNPAVIAPLQAALADPDPNLRAHAAVTLARLGRLSDLAIFEDILSRRKGYDTVNMPFGASGTRSSVADRENIYSALAPIADGKVLELFLRHAPRRGDYDHEKVVYPQLGAALRRHPEVLPVMLKANAMLPGGDSSRDFAWRIAGLAGKEMLPALHEALKSDDRVVRHNAARACGVIGDSHSIPLLIAALDLESGLSRGGIAWALGELKAVEALPHLARLYVDARNDMQRRAGSGFRMSQAAAVMQDQYVSISRVESVGADWDELKASLQPASLDPVKDEPLLTPELILEAVRKIGPDVSQEFYRTLAGEKDREGRLEAARQLTEIAPAQRDKNLPILRNLLSDPDADVRLAAAVTLVLLGQDTGRAPILAALSGTESSNRHRALLELGRARGQLAFAQKEIQACAGDPTLRDQTRELARTLLE